MSKIKKLKQAHGKDDNFQPSTLDQVWGDTGITKYNTMDTAVYTETLGNMNLSDLQSHAVKLGVVPVDNRELLTKKLLKEFNSFTASFKQPKSVNKPTPVSKQALKILSEGR